MRGAVSKGGGNASPAAGGRYGERTYTGNAQAKTPTRARRRKLDTAKVDLEPPRRNCGGQGAHREVGSEGFAEQYRAVVEGATP